MGKEAVLTQTSPYAQMDLQPLPLTQDVVNEFIGGRHIPPVSQFTTTNIEFPRKEGEEDRKRSALLQLREQFPPAPAELSGEEKRIHEQERKFALIDWLQADFDRTMPEDAQDRAEKKEEGVISAYNPVLNVANLLLLEMDTLDISDEETSLRKKNWEILTAFDIHADLRERFHVRATKYQLQTQDGKIFSFLLSRTKPFEEIVADGIEYRKNQGSLEQEREHAEGRGLTEVIQPWFMNEAKKEDGTTDHEKEEGKICVIISPKGKDILIKDPINGREKRVPSNYWSNLVDIQEKKRDPITGEYYIQVTRFSCSLSDEDYEKAILQKLDPGFAERNTHLSFASRCLIQPFTLSPGKYKNAEALFEDIFFYDPKAMSPEEFAPIYESVAPSNKGLFNPQDYYIQTVKKTAEDILFHGFVNWDILSVRFNALLNIADDTYARIQELKKYHSGETFLEHIEQHNIIPSGGYRPSDIDNNIGQRETRSTGSDCGNNDGVKRKKNLSDPYLTSFERIALLLNSVGEFGIENGFCEKIRCSRCGWEPTAVQEDEIGKSIVECPECGWAPGQPIEEKAKEHSVSRTSQKEKLKISKQEVQQPVESQPTRKTSYEPLSNFIAIGISMMYVRRLLREQEEKQKEPARI